MFTGLIAQKGKIASISRNSNGMKLEINSDFKNIELGESIAINGVCTTVTNFSNNIFSVEIMNETVKITNFDKIKTGDFVNLELAMLTNSRFAGHIVTGHIDTTAKLENIKQDGFSSVYKFLCDTNYIVKKGSICINGVSLTISDVNDKTFEVSLIPKTLSDTNLGDLKINDTVNIEFDIFAKYIEKYLEKHLKGEKTSENNTKIDENFLRECGF